MGRQTTRTGPRGRSVRLAVETLEGRANPATFGVPWADPSHLTLSFVPDGTPVAGHVSTLFSLLNATKPTATWQREVLRAFQTWAVNANINIGLAADGGQALGIAGQTQRDARFGDIRVGAQPMSGDALAVSVPNDPAVSGTMTGDVLINSTDNFNSGKLDLFAVVLHEAGHVFGLPGNADVKSVMYENYQATVKLSPGDLAALQALYGTRAPDANEGSGGNNATNKATSLQPAGGNTGATPLAAFGDVTTNSDVDFYAFKAPNGYGGAVTVRVQSAGVSLLAPKVTLLDAKGKTLATAQASSGFGDVVTLRLPASVAGATYYVSVEGATRDVFGIGGYGLAVSFDGRNTVPTARIDSVLRGPYQTLPQNDLAALLQGKTGVLVRDDAHGNDDPIAATVLTSQPGYARNGHYETVGSLSGTTDADFYRIRTADAPPKGVPLVLTVTARALGVNGATPRVSIFTGDGLPVNVPVRVISNGNGSFSIQAVGLKAGGNYLLRVGPSASVGSPATGNYALTAHFSTVGAQLRSLAAGSIPTAGSTLSANLYVGRSQLMHLLLSANTLKGATAAPGSAVKMTIRDKNGKAVAWLTAAAGDTVSGPDVLLTPGAYVVQYTLVGTAGLGLSLAGSAISDPIGPVLFDPTLSPQYQTPGLPGWFSYPGINNPTTDPFYFASPSLA
ncbi:MAG: matrixin family metalloprotease [Isosphaeraceae bacterium]